jgi:translation initiation factor 2-alpha kinase 4
MAPPKTPKNQKQPQKVLAGLENGPSPATSPIDEMLPVRSLMSALPTETYEKAQEDEREVLKAIYMDDYVESEATGAWSVSRLSLSSARIGKQLDDSLHTPITGANVTAENN